MVKKPLAKGWITGSGRSPGIGKATHSSLLTWRIPKIEEPGMNPGGRKSQTQWSERGRACAHTHTHTFKFYSKKKARRKEQDAEGSCTNRQ